MSTPQRAAGSVLLEDAAERSGDTSEQPGSPPPPPLPPSMWCQHASGPRCQCQLDRAAIVTQYLREAVPPLRSPPVLVLPQLSPPGQMVLGCDTVLPDMPYGQECCAGKASAVASRRRVSRMAVQWLRQDRQLQANLMWAVRFNDTDRVRQLVSMGSDANEPDALGRTPLHVAASQGYADMVELLLGLGARPSPQDRRQNTPLHLAVCTSRWAVTQQLLSAGASVWTPNGANMSALQLARGKLNMVLRLKVQGTFDFDKHIEELKAVHELVKSALNTSRASDNTPVPTDAESLASVLEQIDNLSISGPRPPAAPPLSNVNAQLQQMSLASGGGDDKA